MGDRLKRKMDSKIAADSLKENNSKSAFDGYIRLEYIPDKDSIAKFVSLFAATAEQMEYVYDYMVKDIV